MKRNYFLLLVMAAIFVWGCDGLTEPDIFQGPDFVAYSGTTPSFSLAENSTGSVDIVVNMSAAQSSDTQITLGVENVNVAEGVDYMITGLSGNNITIPAGEFSTSFSITPIDNTFFNSDGAGDPLDRRLVFTLSSNSANLVNGLAEDATRQVVFVDDDCPISITDFVGTYTVDEVFSEGGVNAGLTLSGAFGESYQLEFSLPANDPTNTQVIINNSAGFNEYIPDGTLMTFNTCDQSITFNDGDPEIATFATMVIETTAYSESNFTVEAFGPLGNFGPYQFAFIRQ